MKIIEQETKAVASISTHAKPRSPYVTVRQGEDIIQAIVRHRRETGYMGGMSVTFDRPAA
jgi:hypothetical protein